jgi:hypothetical protein
MAWCLLVLQGCPVDTVNINEDLSCDNEGELSGLRVCQGGVWVLVEGDLDLGTGDMPDTSADMPDGGACTPETDVELCATNNRACGALGGVTDRCGQARDIAECGPCGNAEACMAGSCVPECDGQTSAILCSQAGAQCGDFNTVDSCGNARQIGCGVCDDDRDVCQADENRCVCVPSTEAELCRDNNAQCGILRVDDGCGQMVDANCGGCADMAGDFNCGRNGNGERNQCVCDTESNDQFCGRASAQCGMVEAQNNCGQLVTINCGSCDNNDPCNANKTCPVCQPFNDAALCANAGLQCGTHTVTNNCGDSVQVTCSSCLNDTVCNNAGLCECPSPSCNGIACGLISNACGESSNCPNTCNATTQRCAGNACECKPETDTELCDAQGATCGTINTTDRCGASRTAVCGSCGGGQVCTSSNVCCTPEFNSALCAANNRECGGLTATDNCGVQRTVNTCGSCEADESCNSGACECDRPSCAGVECGMVSNACGRTRNCPDTCNAVTETCTGNACECVAETDAELCSNAGAECGSITVMDRCMMSRTVTCTDTCAMTETCTGNACTCVAETDAELCSDAGAVCGTIDVVDRCGTPRNGVSCDAFAGCSGTQTCTDDNTCCDTADVKDLCDSGGFCDPSTTFAVAACGGVTVSNFDCSSNTCGGGSDVCDTSQDPDQCCTPAVLDADTLCNGSCDAQTFMPGCNLPGVPVDCAMICTDNGDTCNAGNNNCQ